MTPRPLRTTALLGLALVAGTLALAPLLPRLDRHWRAAATLARVDALLAAGPRALPDRSTPAVCAPDPWPVSACFGSAAGRGLALSMLASWQTIGGCGAGASTGGAGGVKWIGRNVRGGLFHVECQANYVDVPEGYQFVGTSLVSADLSPKWNLGVSVPYLYKFMYDPFKLGVDLANKGPGDVNLLLTRRLGATNDWNVTLSAGLPTGTSDTAYLMQPLKQDLQLGLGKPTASLIVDHTLDNLWGPIVLGGTANWRGGENQYRSYRAPSASVYSYVSYLLGPLAPAAGLSLTGFCRHRSRSGRANKRCRAQPWPPTSRSSGRPTGSRCWSGPRSPTTSACSPTPSPTTTVSATGGPSRSGVAFAPF